MIHKINTEPYGYPLKVCFSEDWDKDLKRIEKILGREITEKRDAGVAATFYNYEDESRGSIMIFKYNPEQLEITHETFHAVCRILNDWAGTNLTDSSEEAYAYLAGYIAEQITDIYKKHYGQHSEGIV